MYLKILKNIYIYIYHEMLLISNNFFNIIQRSLELTLAQELDQISQMEMQLEHEKLQVFSNLINSIKFTTILTFLSFKNFER